MKIQLNMLRARFAPMICVPIIPASAWGGGDYIIGANQNGKTYTTDNLFNCSSITDDI